MSGVANRESPIPASEMTRIFISDAESYRQVGSWQEGVAGGAEAERSKNAEKNYCLIDETVLEGSQQKVGAVAVVIWAGNDSGQSPGEY